MVVVAPTALPEALRKQAEAVFDAADPQKKGQITLKGAESARRSCMARPRHTGQGEDV